MLRLGLDRCATAFLLLVVSGNGVGGSRDCKGDTLERMDFEYEREIECGRG
jgi:hypothetical protein